MHTHIMHTHIFICIEICICMYNYNFKLRRKACYDHILIAFYIIIVVHISEFGALILNIFYH